MATCSFTRKEILDQWPENTSDSMSFGEDEYLDRELEESGDDLR